MPRLIRRNRALRKLDTAVLVEWLATARKRGYAGAVLSLELELSARHVFDDALPEPRFPISFIADRTQRAVIQLARLTAAVETRSPEWFHADLYLLDPANFAEAWLLARSFENISDRAEALLHVAFWIASYFKGPDEAKRIIAEETDLRTPQQIIQALENRWGVLIDASTEVHNA